jgi:hypothetical protein
LKAGARKGGQSPVIEVRKTGYHSLPCCAEIPEKLKIIAIVSALLAAFAGNTLAAPVDYARDVKPLLAERCYQCHGASQQKSGLRLDTAAFARKGGEHGAAIKPGRSSDSLLVQTVEGKHGEISRMPYKKPPLSAEQTALLKRWIDEGAKAPADEQTEAAKHWAFVPPQRDELPAVKKRSWPRNAIDYFILARLEKEGIVPSPEADRVTLIRRLSLDLLGLPPTPEEVDEFVNNSRPDAYERLVDRLLASPHYGERWGRWWLDAARYADSNGYSIDAPRQIWKYRDWVVDALNRDLPFDEFTIEQLAGDLLPNATVEQKIATGFHRNTQINQEGGIDPEQFRVESVIDRVNTTATVSLGVTLACAQCHDHKFDPFTQREYYQMFAFFNNTVEDGHGQGTPGGMLEVPGEFERMDGIEKEIAELEEDLDRYLNTQGSALQKWEQSLTPEEVAELKSDAQEALKVTFAERTPKQRRIVYAAFKADDPEFKQRNGRLTKLLKREPKPVTTLMMQELSDPRETHVLIKGDFTRPGDRVTPGLPAILQTLEAAGSARGPRADSGGSPESSVGGGDERESSADSRPQLLNRLDLARWIVATNNPLTARVIVNRVWQQYFGKGIVETENDFGTKGIPPTHPELLDWLACEFISPVEPLKRSTVKTAAGSTIQPFNASTSWSLKHLHRLIVNSATYRQSSKMRPELLDLDPNNKLLARQSRLRLDAEVVRDVALAASSLLSRKLGGPPVFPPQPDGVMTLGQVKRSWKASEGDDRYRRGLYTHFWRATPHPALAVFDAADGFSACTRRIRSDTPLQALTLLNDQQFYELARSLATRVLRDVPDSDVERLGYAFRLCVARKPDDAERRRLNELLAQQIAVVDGDAALKRTEAWTTVARVLLNLDETITRE